MILKKVATLAKLQETKEAIKKCIDIIKDGRREVNKATLQTPANTLVKSPQTSMSNIKQFVIGLMESGSSRITYEIEEIMRHPSVYEFLIVKLDGISHGRFKCMHCRKPYALKTTSSFVSHLKSCSKYQNYLKSGELDVTLIEVTEEREE
ncbi:hypothetical protein HA402_002772 [Bradysia odoriphaga]|nr:hypothetical protein HA402_002772 [Bradysia odoriphaga]